MGGQAIVFIWIIVGRALRAAHISACTDMVAAEGATKDVVAHPHKTESQELVKRLIASGRQLVTDAATYRRCPVQTRQLAD